MKTVRSVLVVLALACLLACGGSNVEGTYYNVANDKEYIELKKDGTFYLKAGTLDFSGKYVVDGKSIVLNPESKMAAKGRIENDVITDNDGTRWKRR